MSKKLDEREALERLQQHIDGGNIGPFLEVKLWVYDNLPEMSAAGWSQLRSLLRKAYGMSDDALAKEFSAVRSQVIADDFTPLIVELEVKGFLLNGMNHTAALESPNAFGFWCFMTILAAALRRQVYVDMDFFKIWPAMQTFIIAPSQRGGKSTIGDYIVDNIAIPSGRINMLLDEGSQEGLKKELQFLSDTEGESTGLIYVSEMGTMFGDKDYNKDMVKNLTDLFDNRNRKKRVTVTHGAQEIKNMAVSAILCSNERWVRESVPPSAMEGGWWARLLPIWCQGSDKIVPIPKMADRTVPEQLIAFMKRTAFLKGVAKLDKGGLEYYEAKYRQMRASWPENPQLHPFWNRYPAHMLRVGMLLAISENIEPRDEIIISRKNIYQADRLMEWILLKLPNLYAVLSTNEHGDNAVLVIQFIKGKGGVVEEKDLGRAMMRRMPSYVMKRIVQDLCAWGVLVRRPSKAINGGHKLILLSEDQ